MGAALLTIFSGLTELYSKKRPINFLAFILLFAVLTGCSSLFKNKQFVLDKNGDEIHDALIDHEKKWRGTPYAYGGNSHNGIDCSAYTQRAFYDQFGIKLPRTTDLQIQLGLPVLLSELKAGDLVFFQMERKSLHVGVYLSKSAFAHAGYSSGVTLSRLNLPVWREQFLEARRILVSP